MYNTFKEVKIGDIVKKSLGVAILFSKLQPKATVLAVLSLFVVALALQFAPIIGVILALFATIPGIVLWNKSKASYGITAVAAVILSTLLGNTFVLSAIIAILFMSFVIGQLLIERTPKEGILYITTTFISLIAISGFMVLQYLKVIPTAEKLIEPLKTLFIDAVQQATMFKALGEDKQIVEEGFRLLSVQLPAYAVIAIFIFVLINLLITFPLVRKFKVATPVFKPLYAWQMRRSLIWVYFFVLIGMMFAMEPSPFQTIVLNFRLVLELVMYIQGLSLIHYFGKVKRMPQSGSVGLMVLGTVMTPLLPIVSLLGMLDLGINLKRMIKK